MHPFVFFSMFLSFISAATFVAADHTEAIDNNDSRISYSGDWKYKKSARGDGRTLSFNDKPSGAASLKVYNASRIAVSVFVEAPGQTVRISLDNQDHDVTPVDSQQPAWTSDSLDPKVPHDLQVNKQNPPGQFLELDSIIVTYYDPPTATTEQVAATVAQSIGSVASPAAVFPSSQSMSGASSFGPLPSGSSPEVSKSDAAREAKDLTSSNGSNAESRTTESARQSDPSALLTPQASSTFSSQQPNTEPILSGGKLAAVVVASIIVPALTIVGIILHRRKKLGRKRKAASTVYREWVAAHGRVQPGRPFSPAPPDEKFGDAEDSGSHSQTDDPQAVAVAF